MTGSPKIQTSLMLHNGTKLELHEGNKLVLVSAAFKDEVEIGYCTLTDPKQLRDLLANFSTRIA